jgi:hypothetical protein
MGIKGAERTGAMYQRHYNKDVEAEPEDAKATYTARELLRMDAKFSAAMERAIAGELYRDWDKSDFRPRSASPS